MIDRRLWADLLALRGPDTARDFLNLHSHQIQYVEVDSTSILADVDTPSDYAREKPK
jgi:CTP:molybdopterin cytidylyltransferase MocA